ncbi:hypothetical protein Theam_1777 (plasmid) [Thermovibrio ammonificans HB-1]|uniref:Peptidase S8/S53 domain-containing protein n=1 Tax=Thermovibrio ammonificans (strain DSM 15698 / JCM 12110 / HB-1) TaxID=648996 RepID=E8T712_THEA1|nr:hypothetical protein [Thermovibrio ammonificans]ADU97733.1 hypothetical protein Theam_1777 [Thermovibrio ammonificans HB-1]
MRNFTLNFKDLKQAVKSITVTAPSTIAIFVIAPMLLLILLMISFVPSINSNKNLTFLGVQLSIIWVTALSLSTSISLLFLFSPLRKVYTLLSPLLEKKTGYRKFVGFLCGYPLSGVLLLLGLSLPLAIYSESYLIHASFIAIITQFILLNALVAFSIYLLLTKKPVGEEDEYKVKCSITSLFFIIFVAYMGLFVYKLHSFHGLSLKNATVSWKKFKEDGSERDFIFGEPEEDTITIHSYLLKLSQAFGVGPEHDKQAKEAFEKRLSEGLKTKEATVVVIDFFGNKNKKLRYCFTNKALGLMVFLLPCYFTHGELVEKVLKTALPKELKYHLVRKKAEEWEEALIQIPREFDRELVLVNISLEVKKRGICSFEYEYQISQALTKLDKSGIRVFQAAGNLDEDWKFGDLELAKQIAFILPNITTVGAREFQVGELIAPGRVIFRWPNGVELSVEGTSFSTPIALGAVLREKLKEEEKGN